MIVTYKEYLADKQSFFKAHGFDYTCDTSSMDEHGIYFKTYVFHDSAIWYERMAPVYDHPVIEVRGCKCKVEVKLFETEYWSSDYKSKVYYEQF